VEERAVAEMSVDKGRAVAQIEGAHKHSNGQARAKVGQARGGEEREEREQGQEEPFEEFLVEIGEEARRNLRQAEEEAPAGKETEPERAEGVKKVDVVI
jgi:hypothetical protein